MKVPSKFPARPGPNGFLKAAPSSRRGIGITLLGLGFVACGTSSTGSGTAASAPSGASACLETRGCPESQALPVCSTPAEIVSLAQALDSNEVEPGQPVAVEGILERGARLCTRLFCKEGLCCNRCDEGMELRDEGKAHRLALQPADGRFSCTGDESLGCCGTETGIGRVRIIGNVRGKGALRQIEVREICRVDESLLASRGRACLKETGCARPAKSAGFCTRRKDEVYVGDLLDNPSAHAGRVVHVKGRIGTGQTMCTQMACEEGTCCNLCSARMTVGDDKDRTLSIESAAPIADGETDPYVCAGDDSWQCCKTFASGQLGVVAGTLGQDGTNWVLVAEGLCDL